MISSPNSFRVIKSRRMKWAGHVARMEERRVLYKGKRPLGGPRRKWEDNIETDLQEMGYVVTDWL